MPNPATTPPCMCAQLFGDPCPAEGEADCRIVYRHTVLRVTSECMYAALDTDKVEREGSQCLMPWDELV